MKKAFRTDVFRSITHSMSRFIAITMIVALGTGFYTGLRSTAPDMRQTTDQYADDSHMMDLQGISTLGFTEEEVAAIRNTEGVENVMAGYTVDAISELDGTDQVIRIHSLPDDHSEENDSYLNRPVLVAGRMPERSGECLIGNQKYFSENDVLGSTITLKDEDGTLDDQLATTEYTIVGVVDSSYYISFNLGTTELGSGSLDYFMYIPESDFTVDVYTELFATVAGAAELNSFSSEYEDLVGTVSSRLEELADERTPMRLEELRSEGQQELDDAQQEYDDAKEEADQQLEDARKKLEDAEQQIQDSETQLEDARKKLADGETAWQEGTKEYQDGLDEFQQQKQDAEQKLEDAQQLIDENRETLESQKQELEQAQQELENNRDQIDQLRKTLEEMDRQHEQLIDQLGEAEDAGDTALAEQIAEQIKQLTEQMGPLQGQVDTFDQNEKQVTEGLQQVDSGLTQLDIQQETLDQSRETTQQQLDQAEQELQDAKQQLDDSRKELDDGYAELETGTQQLEEARQEVEDGWAELKTQSQEAEEQLADAQQQIDDGRQQLEELEEPTWYWLDRDANAGFASMKGDADRMTSLSTVFPIMFFLVAALVALTTMTRMVEEERTLIGTYKALGYRNGTIMSKYLLYALLATILGSILGILFCNALIPAVCWNSYRIMYTVPDVIAPLRIGYALGGIAASLVCTMGATFLSCISSLRETPAALMQPKAPKAGKRILLERITPVWKRLNFIHKVTARNLFRYKKRLFMTIIGIAGCTGLLLTGFGIKDSVSAVVGLQYSEILHYDTTIQIQSEDELSQEATALLQNPDSFTDYLLTHTESTDIASDTAEQSASVVVPKQAEKLSDFITLRTRIGHDPIAFDGNAVVITEKLAKNLGVEIGDTVSIDNEDGTPCSFTITGITENYLYNYLYVAPQQYEDVMGETPEYRQILAKSTTETTGEESQLSNRMLALDGVETVQFNSALSDNFDTMIASLDYVILVIVLFAGVLAFIVLYNLTNINITERQREIATIKVLGFFDREVSAYVFRETGILTILGSLAGLVFGVVLHHFTINTVEVEMVMFGRQIQWPSFLYAFALTLLFAVLVDVVMYRKLKKISMVESLKSID